MTTSTKDKRRPPWPSERNHILLTAGLSFWIGCVLAAYFDAALWAWLLLGLALILGWSLYGLGKPAGVALALAVIALGVLRTMPGLHPAAPEAGIYETITGNVYGEARLRADSRVAFTLCNVTLDGAAQPGRAYCTMYYGDAGLPRLFDGAALSFTGRVYLPEGKSGPPRFDFRQWMLQNRMSYGVAISQAVTVNNSPHTAPIMDWAYRVRERFKAALESVMGDNARLAAAMLLGEREGVAEQEYAAFRELGIAHVLAISGLHVGLMGTILMLMMNKIRLRKRPRYMLLGAFLLAYCSLTGMAASALRAATMLMVVELARAWDRKPDPLTSLGTAILVVLLIDPLQATSAGFILSFSAVGGILLLTPTLRRGVKRLWSDGMWRKAWKWEARRGAAYPSISIYRLCRWVERSLCLSLGAQLGVLLPTAMFFHAVPLYGVVINLFIIPYVGLLVPVYALALLLSPIPLIGIWVGGVASWLSDILLRLVLLLGNLPYASVRVASPDVRWLAAGLGVMVALSLAVRAAWWRRALAVGLICAVTGLGTWLMRPPDIRYVQLAVGQADAALLYAGSETVAIDVGADGAAVVDYLMDTGRDLDALFLTHLHLDHAGGVAALLEAGIDIERIYLPVNGDRQRLDPDCLAVLSLLAEYEIPVHWLARGDELRYNGVVVTVLWPDGDKARVMQDANSLPMVLSVTMDGYTVLCTSDLTGDYERYAAVPCDVLKVAHHGSRDSTRDDFLNFLRPGMAIISCSSGSRSLPSPETLERLSRQGIPVLRTDEAGDITLWVEDGTLHIAPYR